MLKKIIVKIFIINFLLINSAQSAESSGMPQLNPEFWVSQIFWLILTFGILYLVLSKIVLPKISENLETRKSQIVENIETAEKQRKESEQKIKEYNKIINDSKIEAKNYFNQNRAKILKDIDIKKKDLENQINTEINEAEIEIQDFKNKTPEKINKIAIEISTDVIRQLTSIEVNNSSISAIVNDLSKEKDKYYGI